MRKPTCENCPYWVATRTLLMGEQIGECRSDYRETERLPWYSCGAHPFYNKWIDRELDMKKLHLKLTLPDQPGGPFIIQEGIRSKYFLSDHTEGENEEYMPAFNTADPDEALQFQTVDDLIAELNKWPVWIPYSAGALEPFKEVRENEKTEETMKDLMKGLFGV